MIKKVPQIGLIILSLCAPLVVSADNLLETFNLAIQNDPTLKAAQSARMALLEEHSQTFSKYFPTISIYSQVGKKSQNLQQVAFVSDDILGTTIYDEINLGISLIQPLYNVAIYRNRSVSEVKVVQAELDYRIAQESLIYRLSEGYFGVLASQDSLNYARGEKNAIARQLKQAKERFKIGLSAVTDVHEAQARHDIAIAMEINAESELADQKEQLRQVTGKLHNQLLPLKPDTPLIPPTPVNMEDWTEAARDQNLHIAKKKLEADLIKEQKEVTRAGHFPTLDLYSTYGYNKSGGAFFWESVDATVSVNFNMPLFKGNILASKTRQQQYTFEQTIQEIEAKEREVLKQTRSAYLGVLAGMSYVKALNQAVKSSAQALKTTIAGFDVGTRSAIQVLNAQRELFQNQRGYSRARYDYILSMLKLKIAVGLLSIDDLEQINSWLQ